MAKTFIVFIFLAVFNNLIGQEPTIFSKNQIKFSPFRLIDWNSGIELSYERLHQKPRSSQLSVARLQNIFYENSIRVLKGYRISVEEKCFYKETRRAKRYLSAEGVFLRGNYKDRLLRNDTSNSKFLVDTFTVRKETVSINFKHGFQLIFNPVVFDFSIGIGLKYRRVRYADIEPSHFPITVVDPTPFDFTSEARKEGKYFTMNLPINLKIGIVF